MLNKIRQPEKVKIASETNIYQNFVSNLSVLDFSKNNIKIRVISQDSSFLF